MSDLQCCPRRGDGLFGRATEILILAIRTELFVLEVQVSYIKRGFRFHEKYIKLDASARVGTFVTSSFLGASPPPSCCSQAQAYMKLLLRNVSLLSLCSAPSSFSPLSFGAVHPGTLPCHAHGIILTQDRMSNSIRPS